MYLLGSRALAIRAPHLLNRQPKDFDFLSTEDEALAFIDKNNLKLKEKNSNKIIAFQGELPLEFEIIEENSSNSLLKDLIENDSNTIDTQKFGKVPSLEILHTLKESHIYKKNSPHFWKTAFDVHAMRKAGCVIPEKLQIFFKKREKETYNYSHPKLNVKKKDFFKDDQVNYIYDHDSIHEAVKLYERPAYTYAKQDQAEVMLDKKKFFDMDVKYQLATVIEESCVLALERSQIPYPGVLTPKQSYALALSKVCSSITSGWWRAFAYDHIFESLNSYNENYIEKFQRGLEEGIIKPFKKEE